MAGLRRIREHRGVHVDHDLIALTRGAAKYGGVHHGAFLPHEGPNNIALHLFSFPSLAEYERYRTAVRDDEAAKAAWRLAEETRCILSFERSFMRPIFEGER